MKILEGKSVVGSEISDILYNTSLMMLLMIDFVTAELFVIFG